MSEPVKTNLACQNKECKRHQLTVIGDYYRLKNKCPSCGQKNNFLGNLHPKTQKVSIKEPSNPLLKKLLYPAFGEPN
jgi:hypothetical protein